MGAAVSILIGNHTLQSISVVVMESCRVIHVGLILCEKIRQKKNIIQKLTNGNLPARN